jgi:hypothetical protein
MRFRLKFPAPSPITHHMVNPISSSQASQSNEAAKSAASKPQPQQAQQKTAPQPSDTVTLKSTGQAESNGDSK